jgi:hypothetical protein
MLSMGVFGYSLLGKEVGCMIIQLKLQSDNMMLRMVYIALIKY